ncbi:MAG: hypothetical protein ACHQTE_00910 [Candidatus Saccharimonadales bacterium]
MSETAVTGLCNESPETRIDRLIGTGLVEHCKAHPADWPLKDRLIAIACVKYLAFGAESYEASRHHSKEKFIFLTQSQSDVLYTLQYATTWED